MSDAYPLNKSVATWLSTRDYAMLQHLAFKNKVTVSSYMRACIVDAIQDEAHTLKLSPTIRVNQQVV